MEILGDHQDRCRAREHLECVSAPLDHRVTEILDLAVEGGPMKEIAQLGAVHCGEPLVGGKCVGHLTRTAGDLVGGHLDDGHPRCPRGVGQRRQ